jgi:hypothetical protein
LTLLPQRLVVITECDDGPLFRVGHLLDSRAGLAGFSWFLLHGPGARCAKLIMSLDIPRVACRSCT